MLKFKKTLTALSLYIFSAQSTLAEAICNIDGDEVPCDQISGLWLLIPVAIILLGVLLFFFWLWMLIDALKNQKEHKFMWVMVIVLLALLGALIYYFIAKRNRKKSQEVRIPEHPVA